MKLRNLLLSGLLASSLSLLAQTHKEGIEYYKADQFTNAKELLLRNLNNPGTDKSLSDYYLGQLEMRYGKVNEATKYFNEGIQLNPENPYNYIGLGYIDLKAGKVKEAEKQFKEAESKAKKDQSVQVEIARAYYNADPIAYKEKYEKRIANAKKKDLQNPDIYIFEGDVLRNDAYQTGDQKTYGTAASLYDVAMGYDPTSAVAYVKYADMFRYAKNLDFAIKKLEELIRNNPNSALGQRELANAYYDHEEYTKAADQYGKYVKNPSHFKNDEDQYAFLLFYDKRYKDGYDYATSLLAENPSNFTAQRFQFMNAAQIDSMNDQLLGMAEDLLAKHRSNKDNRFAPIDYNLISDELTKDNRPDEAIELLQEGLTQYPQNNYFKKVIAQTHAKTGNYNLAYDAFTDYINSLDNPGYNEYAQLAIYGLYAGMKKENANYLDKAIESANKAKEFSPDFYYPEKLLGDIEYTKGSSNDKVVEHYEKALQLIESAENPDAYSNDAKNLNAFLGDYYYNKKDTNKAKAYYTKYTQFDPSNADINKRLQGLK